MADDHELQVQIGSVLEPFIERFGRKTIREAVEAALSNPPGRPKGWAIDDWTALENMHLLIRSGKAETPTDAARRSLLLTDNHNSESTVRRLREKYRTVEAELEERVANREVRQAVEAFEVLYRDLLDARRKWIESAKKQTERASVALERAARAPMEDLQAAFARSLFPLPAEQIQGILGSGDKLLELFSGAKPSEE